MAIVDAELKFYKSAVVNDTSANGGTMSASVITTNVQQNVFPHVFKSERDNGKVQYRKVFCKVANDDDDELFSPKVWLHNETAGDDVVTFCVTGSTFTTFIDTETDFVTDLGSGDKDDSEDHFGCAPLQTNVSSGTVISVTVPSSEYNMAGDYPIFRDGMTIGISNKATPDLGTGTTDFHTIASLPTDEGSNVVDIDVTVAVSNTYTTANTVVFGVYEPGDLAAIVENEGGTGAARFDHTEVTPDNIGAIRETITITADGTATNFTVSGSVSGSHTGGTVGSAYTSDNNTDFSKPYFAMAAAATTSLIADDVVTFDIIPAAFPIWERREVPSGASALTGNSVTLAFTGEAA